MRITFCVCLMMALGAAAMSNAAPQGGGAAFKPPDWIRRPGPDEILSVYPREAMQRGISGSATISCTVTAQGGLRECRVVSEKPSAIGFGAAALALTPQFLLRPATRNGIAVESGINIPIRFEWDGRTSGTFIQGASTTRAAGVVRVYSGPLAWTQAPTLAELVAAFPSKARAEKTGGRVSLDCKFTAAGKLTDCVTLREEPNDLGFGHAARSLVEKFQGPTLDAEGHAMAGAHTQLAFAFPVEALAPEGPRIGQPKWAALPTPADLAAALPAKAKTAGVLRASVMLQCSVGADGALAGCTVQAEAPGDLGYGQSALSLAGRFRVGLWTEEGLPTAGGVIRLPINFDYSVPPAAKP